MPRAHPRQEQAGQHVEHSLGRDATIHFQGKALARELVGDCKPLQWLPRRRPVVDEVPRPNVIRMLCAASHATIAAVAQTPFFAGLSPAP